MSHPPKPLVIILDVDGTLIGDIRQQIMVYDLHQSLKRIDKKLNVMNVRDLQFKLRSCGIVRPFFSRFVRKLPNIEFFIYTASEKNWAHFLIPHIEKALNIKFHRPLFTREHCTVDEYGGYRKHMRVVFPLIVKTLKKKYPTLTISDLQDHVMMIDNNKDVFDEIDQQYVVQCPTYDYKFFENVPCLLTQRLFDQHKVSILSTLSSYIDQIANVTNYTTFQLVFYKNYVNMLSIIQQQNHKQLQDRFFAKLMQLIVIKKINIFSPKVLHYLSFKTNRSIKNTA
jgi:hypothetical protein